MAQYTRQEVLDMGDKSPKNREKKKKKAEKKKTVQIASAVTSTEKPQ